MKIIDTTKEKRENEQLAKNTIAYWKNRGYKTDRLIENVINLNKGFFKKIGYFSLNVSNGIFFTLNKKLFTDELKKELEIFERHINLKLNVYLE